MADLDPNIEYLEEIVEKLTKVTHQHIEAQEWSHVHEALDALVHANNATCYAVINRNDIEFYPIGHANYVRHVIPNDSAKFALKSNDVLE